MFHYLRKIAHKRNTATASSPAVERLRSHISKGKERGDAGETRKTSMEGRGRQERPSAQPDRGEAAASSTTLSPSPNPRHRTPPQRRCPARQVPLCCLAATALTPREPLVPHWEDSGQWNVRNEIAVLKKVSRGNPNIVTLHDYFETSHNLYLCFDLCTGGELFDRICAKGNYYEADAAELVRTIMGAVKYIHGCGIVQEPENLLFRTKDEDADIMIAIWPKSSGHGKPVDVWAMGVITYFLLCAQEMEAILAVTTKRSQPARDFVASCLTIDPAARPTAEEALQLPWLAAATPHYVADPESPHGGPKDLLPQVKKAFDAKKTFRKAVLSMVAMRRMSTLAHTHTLDPQIGGKSLRQLLEESEKEHVDGEHSVMHFDSSSSEGGSSGGEEHSGLVDALSSVKLSTAAK
ncbi:kinase-like domain-containing protein [Fomitopsis serialis]|uniref:kinase-like domain-containing protein n=1 Tax=Fomitopsis serialis TaxID=139415 RepID=UPI002008E689|nr:kinase-like domain-containing protein [Neoantrodia serialis]KAH9914113.1 kinase-like domain-containing protein [Neoantrodia serialis]